MKSVALIFIQIGLLGITFTFMPPIIYSHLFFIDNDLSKFFLSLFITPIITGGAIYIFLHIKETQK